MSLVSTWCQCEDGMWYEDPVWEGPGWFVCLDDDEPPELVVNDIINPPTLEWFQVLHKGHHSGRIFGGDISTPTIWAQSYFGKITQKPPRPKRFYAMSSQLPPYAQCWMTPVP